MKIRATKKIMNAKMLEKKMMKATMLAKKMKTKILEKKKMIRATKKKILVNSFLHFPNISDIRSTKMDVKT
jgi:hypothetical protein